MKSLRRRTRIVVLLDTRQFSAHQIIGGILRYAANHPDWNGMIEELWFEACELIHARVAVDWMRFEQ